MCLVKVNVVCIQSLQAFFHLFHDPAPGRASVIGVVIHRKCKLCGKDHVFAFSLKCLAKDGFRFSVGVNIRGVKIIDTCVYGVMDHAGTFFFVSVTKIAKHPCTKTEFADGDASVT